MTRLAKKQILGGLMIYFIIRVFAYYYSPGTPLYSANPVNWMLSAGILLTAIYFLWKKDSRGWLIIAGEMILGGAGSFFEIYNISLRTLLLICSIIIFFFHQYPYLYPSPIRGGARGGVKSLILENKTLFYILFSLLTIVGIGGINGYLHGHSLKLIIADTIPYLFFLYYFPLKEIWKNEKIHQIIWSMIIATVIGNVIFTLFTLFGFSFNIFVLQDSYYHWFRDVASGKITAYGYDFYRITLNEHLLLIPLLIIFVSRVIARKPQKAADAAIPQLALPSNGIASADLIGVAITSSLLVILSTNLTRIYILALGVGLLFLFSKTNWKRWFVFSTATVVGFFVIFTSLHLLASHGKSLGWEFFGLRLQSIAQPQTEDSSLSRLMLLPKILDKIKNQPLLGTGLGDTVTIYSPIFKQNITTPHFDWGYLEIIAETGVIGMLIWLLLIGYCLLKTQNWTLRASLLSLLIINLTSPTLFHVLGVVFITTIFVADEKTSAKKSP